MTNEQRCKRDNAAFVASKERENAERKRAQQPPGSSASSIRCPIAESSSEGKEGREAQQGGAELKRVALCNSYKVAAQSIAHHAGAPSWLVTPDELRALFTERDTLKAALAGIEKFLPHAGAFLSRDDDGFQVAVGAVRKALFGVEGL